MWYVSHLHDDLSDEPADWDVVVGAECAERLATASALISQPFDYSTVISYSFDTAHWQATRYSDGTRYGVWYGSMDVETTDRLRDRVALVAIRDRQLRRGRDREIATERRVFDVRCGALSWTELTSSVP